MHWSDKYQEMALAVVHGWQEGLKFLKRVKTLGMQDKILNGIVSNLEDVLHIYWKNHSIDEVSEAMYDELMMAKTYLW